MEQIMDPYKVKPGRDVGVDEDNYFLNWFWMHWLPAAGGKQFFNADHKLYKMHVQPIDGETKACISKESEAFGILVCQNCYKKWEAIIPEKHRNPDFEPPKYNKDDKTTHKYYSTLWTVATNGQKEGEGWGPEAYPRLSELIREVKKFRSADKKTGFQRLRACLAYVQSQNGIDVGASEPSKKKRKKQTVKVVYQAIAELSDDDWEEPESS